MNFDFEKTTVLSTLVMATAILLSLMPLYASAGLSGPERANVFLRDVVGLDTEKYSLISVSDVTSTPKDYPGIVAEVGKFRLTTAGSALDVLFEFHNQTLFWCLVRNIEGSPIYTLQPSGDLLDNVGVFLDRYERFSGYSVEEEHTALSMLGEVKDSTVVAGNVKLRVTNNSDSGSFSWSYTFSGVDFPTMGVSFGNGATDTVFGFGEDRGTYEIAGTELNVSREEAINIAWDCARNLTLPYPIRESPVDAKLMTWPREPLTLYPCWEITFYLSMTEPVGPSHVVALIYADTGEVINCHPLTFGGGGPTSDGEPADDSTTSSDSNNTAATSDIALIAASAVIFAVLAGVALLLVKKGRTNRQTSNPYPQRWGEQPSPRLLRML